MSITVKNYAATHGKGQCGGGGTTIIMGGGTGSIPAYLNVTSINAEQGDIDMLKGKSLSYNDGQFVYLTSGDGTINKLRGDEIEHFAKGQIDELNSDLIKAKEIKDVENLEAVKAFIENINSKNITTEYLTVTKQAHFFELIIDKMRSVGGTIILTAANCVVDYVKALDYNEEYLDNVDDVNAVAYDVFWLASDADGRDMSNDWIENDQAICQSFNNVNEGHNYDVSNKYYWRLVTDVLDDRYMNLNTGEELELSESSKATVNSVTITEPYIEYNNTRKYDDWTVSTPPLEPTVIQSTWVDGGFGPHGGVQGTMTTKNTVFGIQMTQDAEVYMDHFGFECSYARLNVGIYYTDGTSQYFPAPAEPVESYRYATYQNAPIEVVVITNADEVEWKKVHGIRLSNTDCDNMLTGYVSIPSRGDNIAQLGYRYQNVSGYPTGGTKEQIISWINNNRDKYDRASAQILCAYNTPDIDVVPPAYAQYTGINDYNLRNHRGTYIDATGGYFKGKLVTTSGNFINITDDGLSVDVDFYKIIPDVNIITIDSNGIVNPSILGVKFLHSGNSTLDSTVPVGCSFNYSIDGGTATTIPAGGTVNILLSQSLTNNSYLTMNLFKDSDLVDNVRMTVTDIRVSAGSQGPQGPQGPIGPQGSSTTDYYTLVPINEMFEVRIGAENVGPQAYENIHGVLYANAKYGVMHVTGDTVSYLSQNEISNLFELEVISNPTGAGLTANSKYSQTGYGTAKINNDTTSTTTIGTIYFEDNNILATMYPNNPTYQDYYTLHWNNGIQIAPQELNIALIKKSDSSQMDHRAILLVFKASHLWSVTDTALNSIYQGLSGKQGKYTSTGFSHIKQTWDQIGFTVSNVVRDNEGALEEDTDVDEYIYQRNNSSDGPTSLPTTTEWKTAPSNWTYAGVDGINYPTPDSSNQYVWKSHRSRTMTLLDNGNISWGTPTSWTTPILYEKYGVNRVGVNSAQLAMTAENINLSVANELRSTGINIEDGTITLDAEKTTINGSLLLTDDDQGFIISNENGTTQITPQSIGTYNNFIQRTYTEIKCQQTMTVPSPPPACDFTQQLGPIKAGKQIIFKDQNVQFMYYNSGTVLTPATISVVYEVYEQGNDTVLYTSTKSSANISGELFNYTIQSDASYYVKTTINATFSNLDGRNINCTLSYKAQIPFDCFTLIGYDGIATNFGNNKTAYIGNQSTIIKYGNNGIKVDTDGIWKDAGDGTWQAFDGFVKPTILDNNSFTGDTYQIQASDTIIYISKSISSGKYITLGDGKGGNSNAPTIGRKLTIINMSTANHTLLPGSATSWRIRTDNTMERSLTIEAAALNVIAIPNYNDTTYPCYWSIM